jgi:hypothetical protein
MNNQDPLEWPTVKPLCSRIREEDGESLYQGSVLSGYSQDLLVSCAVLNG